MSSTIKPKFDQNLERQITQQIAEKRSEVTSQKLSELKNLGQAIKQSHADQRAMTQSTPAINHIKSRSTSPHNFDEKVISSPDNARLYTRQGKFKNQEDSVVAAAEDDFYHVKDRGNTITEDSNGYYINTYAPEHEKSGIRVSISQNKAIISGSRKAQNKEEVQNGLMTTNNFQTFRQEFDLGSPVSSSGMTREREGDYIRFFIPKIVSNTESEES
jgi:HSP20 family molecular chaperone IbpA